MNTLRGLLAALFLAVNTALWCVPLFTVGIVRFLLPIASARRFLSGAMDLVIDGWVGGNRAMNAVLRLQRFDLTWQVSEPLSLDKRYLVLCNHQSWADIIILQNSFRGILPPLKFFTKQQLIWLPLLGAAMWLLGFPYVRRGGAGDREAMARSCRGFREHPVSVLNFLEGTRFTPAKHARNQSPYRHLLPPKLGGMAFVLGELGEHVDQVIDVSIAYPGPAPSFWQFLCGDCPRSRVHIEDLDVPVGGNARELTEQELDLLRNWTHTRWSAKDAWLQSNPYYSTRDHQGH